MIDYRIGDTRDLTRALPDGSVHLVATSPPFLALRSYLPADHEHKHAEIGSEPDPATFLDTLLGLTAEWGRVLAPWGSIAIELGDTYAGSGGAGGDYRATRRRCRPAPAPPAGQGKFNGSARMASGAVDAPQDERAAGNHRVDGGYGSPIRNMDNKVQGGGNGWPRPKCLALIPQLYATSLAYGRNILTGAPSPAGQWLVRNLIVWHRPNPAVGALGDKFRPSTSYIVVATRSPKRWFDLSAVRTATDLRATAGGNMDPRNQRDDDWRRGKKPEGGGVANPAGAPPLDAWFDEHDTWTVTTQPSKIAHYAMWPAKLAERLILSMCPEWVCSTCHEPRRRVERASYTVKIPPSRDGLVNFRRPGQVDVPFAGETLGWTDCVCGGPFTPGVVLDPFAGTFTTGLVAEYHGRDAIGFDLDRRNADLVPLRREEIRRNLNPTHVRQVDGQIEMFGGDA